MSDIKAILDLAKTMLTEKIRRLRIEGLEIELHDSAFREAEAPLEVPADPEEGKGKDLDFGQRCGCGHLREVEHTGSGCLFGCDPDHCKVKETTDGA